MFLSTKKLIMHTEVFNLIPKQMFMSTQQVKPLMMLSLNRNPRNCLSFKETCSRERPKDNGSVQTESSINFETNQEEKEEPKSHGIEY